MGNILLRHHMVLATYCYVIDVTKFSKFLFNLVNKWHCVLLLKHSVESFYIFNPIS